MDQVAVVNNNLSQPKLTPGLLHFERNEKHLFFVPDIPNWIVVNKNSALLLFNCDGFKSPTSIFDSIGLSDRECKNALYLFEEASKRGVLQNFLPTSSKTIAATHCCSNAHSSSLRSIYLKLTDECNLRCQYCYASSGNPSAILSLDTLRKIAYEVQEISQGPIEYVLTGGEPLLNPYALDFAKEATEAGHDVQILTNGALISTEDIARKVAAVAKLVKISVDGSTNNLHSLTRGKGNFDQVTRAIELLDQVGANVLVAMTVTKNNVHDLAKMSARYGSKLCLQPLFKAGRGKGISDTALTGEEYYNAMEAVENIAPMGNVAQTLESIRGRGVRRCALAEREISISETGDVYPCQLLHAPEFVAGNIYSDSIANIYNNSPILKNARRVNVDTIVECSKCPIRLICAGGCRARDYCESGSIEIVGEFCEYEKMAFINGILEYSSFD